MAASGANPRSPSDEDDLDQCICGCQTITVILVLLVGGIALLDSRDDFPSFQLDSVSGSVRNTTALWDICFSINDRISVGNLDVWARFMSRDFKVESLGGTGKSTVSVSTSLPPGADFSAGLTILEHVVFKCNNCKGSTHRYDLMAACKDVVVEVDQSNIDETRGVIMKGGPRLCPLVYHQRS